MLRVTIGSTEFMRKRCMNVADSSVRQDTMPQRIPHHRRTDRGLGAALLCGLWLFAASPGADAQSAPPLVAAASDLQFALAEIAEAFHADSGQRVRVVTGSTGNFARQIRAGARFEVFLAADEQFVFDLYRDGFTRDQGELYAIGRLVMVVPVGSTLPADGTLETLATALAERRLRRFAIANPDHAPYGMRAREALEHRGLWEALQPLLVMGENVSQAAQFALSGSAQGGIVAYSLVLAPEVASRGAFELIPEQWHAPLRQRMVLLQDASPAAEAFYDFMGTAAARAIMTRFGFDVPED